MKSILVIDTPKSCSECMHINGVCHLSLMITKGTMAQGLYVVGYDKHRHPQCPLRELPSKEELEDAFEDLLWNSEVLDKTDLQDYPKYKLLNNLINTIYGSDEE